MSKNYDVVIVGAGHGGVMLATSLVKSSFDGTIALISDEDSLPYERPPLSKAYLKGEASEAELLFRKPEYWGDSPVELLLGTRVTSVNAEEHTVMTGSGESIRYGRLVWAAGGRARMLTIPGADLAGVHGVRTLEDAKRIEAELAGVSDVVIIGGGYIGLEAAAVLRTLGRNVTIVEMQDRLLARVSSLPVSDFYVGLHRERGTQFLFETGVTELRGDGGRVTGVVLDDGRVLAADMVIVGIGLIANVEQLQEAGADGAMGGVVVDEFCRTSLDDVYAIGDCATHVNRFASGQQMRLESVQNATEQAKVVASHIAGAGKPYDVLPWFWSDQYEAKLKTAGLLHGRYQVVLRGEPTLDGFSAVYLRDDRIIAIDSVNRIGDFTHAKALISRGVKVDPAVVADASRPLKDLLPG